MGRAPLRENCHEENSRQSSSKDACTTSGLGSRGARHTFLDGVLAAVCFRTIGRAADSKRVPPSQRELVTRIINSGLSGWGLQDPAELSSLVVCEPPRVRNSATLIGTRGSHLPEMLRFAQSSSFWIPHRCRNRSGNDKANAGP